MQSIIDEFNQYFQGVACIEIRNGVLEVTIVKRTLIISLSQTIGWQSKG